MSTGMELEAVLVLHRSEFVGEVKIALEGG